MLNSVGGYCMTCGHSEHTGRCEANAVSDGTRCVCTDNEEERRELGPVKYDVESSMIRRYGEGWRLVLAQEMEAGLRLRLRDLLASSRRDCKTWNQAHVDTSRLERMISTIEEVID
jgi:hypothetical protein